MVLESTGIRKGFFNVINFLLNKRKFFLYTFHGLHFLNGDNLLTSHLRTLCINTKNHKSLLRVKWSLTS